VALGISCECENRWMSGSDQPKDRTWASLCRDRLAKLSAEQLRNIEAGDLPGPTSADSSPVFEETAWHGGYYELAMILGAVAGVGSDRRLSLAIASAWSHDALLGPFTDTTFTAASESVLLDPHGEAIERLYGAIILPYGIAPLTTIVVREEYGDANMDWLYVACPVGGLGEIHPDVGGYPFEPDQHPNAWQRPLDLVLVDVARRVRTSSNYQRAYIDFEVSGNDRFESAEPGSLFIGGQKMSTP
jgi:hypothetical protein